MYMLKYDALNKSGLEGYIEIFKQVDSSYELISRNINTILVIKANLTRTIGC